MTWLALLISSPLLLWLAYIPAIQFRRGGWWRLMYPFTFAVARADIILNYTVLALYTWDWPRKGEYTFSKRLDRLTMLDGWRGDVYSFVAVEMLDRFDPTGRHV